MFAQGATQAGAEFLAPESCVRASRYSRTASTPSVEISSFERYSNMAKSVFYSFHYDHDVHRVQLVRNINALEGQPVLNAQAWENVQAGGTNAVVKWIDEQMSYKKAVIVLIGKHTVTRPWVKYEIEKAWAGKKPLLGVRIHGLSSLGTVDAAGGNPFDKASGVENGPIFDPTVVGWNGIVDSKATYNKLRENLETWSSKGVISASW